MSKRENISIHALREEGDLPVSTICTASCKFLSTPSARRATYKTALKLRKVEFLSTPSARRATQFDCLGGVNHLISIHALREEGDGLLIAPTRCLCNFYPRPPRGGRHGKEDLVAIIVQFLSTPSARRATKCRGEMQPGGLISIHALREEGDREVLDAVSD